MVIKRPFTSHKIHVFFLTKLQKLEAKKYVFYVLAFDLTKIQISWASQNDHQILNFVKAINVVGKKMTRNSRKMPNSQLCQICFRSEFSSPVYCLQLYMFPFKLFYLVPTAKSNKYLANIGTAGLLRIKASLLNCLIFKIIFPKHYN